MADATGRRPDVPAPPGRVAAFWCRIPSRANFGDALTPWLIRRTTGRSPAFAGPGAPTPHYIVSGSVIDHATAWTTVWGAGIMSMADVICPEARLLAVRGPLTRSRALACGAECPEIYGDPALLLPRFLSARTRRIGIGVVPHFSDMPRLQPLWRASPRARLIDLQQEIEDVVDAITACEVVVSSSLHGIVASHAYGIPAAWIRFRDLPSGDGSKFHDYFLSVGLRAAAVQASYADLDVDRAASHAVVPPHVDLEPFWRACPFR